MVQSRELFLALVLQQKLLFVRQNGIKNNFNVSELLPHRDDIKEAIYFVLASFHHFHVCLLFIPVSPRPFPATAIEKVDQFSKLDL